MNRNGGSKGINNTRDGGQGVSKMDIWKICIQNGYIGRYVSKMDTLEDMYPKCSYGHLDMTRWMKFGATSLCCPLKKRFKNSAWKK